MHSSLHDPFEGTTPSQRLAAVAHDARRARIAANAKPEVPIALPKFIESAAVPVAPIVEGWIERQRNIPLPPAPKGAWFAIVADLGPLGPRQPSISSIQRTTADHFGIRLTEMLAERRNLNLVYPRQIAMYLAKDMTRKSLPEIGRRFGGRDHTTVLHAVRKIERLEKTDMELAGHIDAIRTKVTG